jgi:ABC-type amino acid transport substrate-binding protein
MKRILCLALALIFALGALAGCGNTTQPASSPSAAASPSATESKSEASASASAPAEPSASPSAAAPKTIKDGVLTMVTNAEFPPYEFYENEKIVGIDAEIAQAIADKLGLKLEITDIDFDAIAAAVKSHKADMALAGWTVNEDRKQSVDFSTSYATGVQVIIVKEGSKIATVDDLFKGGFTIGVQQSTTGDLYTTGDIEDKDLGTVNRYNKGADAVAALIAGKVDCVVIDNEPAKVFVKNNPGLKILDTKYIEEQYAIGFSKDNPDLGKAIDKALTELIADGTVKRIIDKYIKAD